LKKKRTRLEVFELVNAERIAQDKEWRTGRPNEQQYKFAAPHVILLERNARKLIDIWYDSKDESALEDRLVKIAALAFRALEEIEVTE